MTHEAALRTLLDEGVRSSDLHGAEEHVVQCKDCWEVVRLVHELVSGGSGATGTLYGCDTIRVQLYLLAGLDPREAAQRHPTVVRHIVWCSECRYEVATLLRVERDAATGIYDDAPAPGAWRTIVSDARERIDELVGTIRVHVTALTAAFADLPVGLTAVPLGTPVALRGDANRRSSASDHTRERLDLNLDDSGLTAHVTVESHGAARQLRLLLEVEGARGAIAMAVHDLSGDAPHLVTARSSIEHAPFVIDELHPGRYLVDVWEVEPRRTFRFTVDVRPGGSRDA